jgi:hypothetical protein
MNHTHTHTQLDADLAGSHFTSKTGPSLSEFRGVLQYKSDHQPSEAKMDKKICASLQVLPIKNLGVTSIILSV